ncbi:MAG: tyrosine-type recombinase/integrase [bacterium]|nr:tyrosine-type recombinase/integrase [bacterium]
MPPRKPKNADVRSREYLTPAEVEQLLAAAGRVGRHGHRDKTLILALYRHGLRVSELVALRWDQVDLNAGLLHVNRRKNGAPSTHPMGGTEIRALRRLKRDYPATQYVFTTERKGPMTASVVSKMIGRAGQKAGFAVTDPLPLLRDARGSYLANQGHVSRELALYLGLRNIQH